MEYPFDYYNHKTVSENIACAMSTHPWLLRTNLSDEADGKLQQNQQHQPGAQQINQTVQGRIIVKTLDGLELEELVGDEHAQAVQRLIVAAVVIVMISLVLIATVVLFRCYMLYCQDFRNIRRYQMPPHQRHHSTEMKSWQNSVERVHLELEQGTFGREQSNGGIPQWQSLMRPTSGMPSEDRRQRRPISATFRTVFDNSEL